MWFLLIITMWQDVNINIYPMPTEVVCLQTKTLVQSSIKPEHKIKVGKIECVFVPKEDIKL